MKVRVLVRLKASILDPQGATVQRALGGLGFDDITSLRVGKLIEIDVPASSEAHARARVDDMCTRLLANPLLEDYTVEVAPASPDADPDAAPAALPAAGAKRKIVSSSPSHRRRSIP